MKTLGIILSIVLFVCSAYQKAEYSEQTNLITLMKSRCRGKCPVYELNINSKGEAVYHGIENVGMIGIFEFKLNNEELDDLKKRFEELKFLEIKLEGKTKIRDISYTTLKYKGKSHYYRSTWKASPFKSIVEKLDSLIEIKTSTDGKK